MTRYKVFDIHWATDGHDWKMLQLPEEVAVSIESDADPDETLPDKLSDLFGWSVNSLDYEAV